jgi:5-methylcytosine-specific restriction endonuclease McrA
MSYNNRNRWRGLCREVRTQILHRYECQCYLCKVPLTVETMTVDHIVPRSRGGTHDLGNLAPACVICNVSKADSLPGESFRRRDPQSVQGAKLADIWPKF